MFKKKRNNGEKRECPICKKIFYAKNRRERYCGDKCRKRADSVRQAEYYQKHKKEKTPIKCKQCGKEFIPYRAGTLFCSPECGHTYRYEHAPKKAPKVFEPRVCPICGMMFVPSAYQQKYCGETCAKEAIRSRKYTYPSDEERRKPRVEAAKVKKKGASTASERWERMSWKEISAECARLHITYGQAQVMAQKGTLPEDFGLGVM